LLEIQIGTINNYLEFKSFLNLYYNKNMERGHSVEAVKKCFKLAKDCGFKIVSHIMPDLPNMG